MTRPLFGGMQISFDGRAETMEEVFGSGDLTPSEMTARLWEFIRRRGCVQSARAREVEGGTERP